jgi:2-polyprenyl-3-methyl-5-hydroxy-6-metoxy-1,4-benzoquinol methylase
MKMARQERLVWIKDILPPIVLRGIRVLRTRLRRDQPAQPVSGAQTASWYDRAYKETESYHRHYTESEYYFLWSVLADRLARREIQRVLDLGCGSGQLAALLYQKKLPAYCGVDFSAQAIELARQACPAYEFRVVDLRHSDLMQTYEYDCVIALEFLEHASFDLEIILQIKAGTRVFASLPNFPYPSHVRYFQDEQVVRQRYQEYFSEFQVDTFLADPLGHAYFLIDAIK